MPDKKRSKTDWTAVRERYVTGDETFRGLAARLSVTLRSVERASVPTRNDGKGWVDRRQEFREKNASKAAERAGDTYANRLVRLSEKAVDVAELALKKLEDRLKGDEIENRDLIATAKLAMSTKLEVTGAGGKPLQIEVSDLRKMTDEELHEIANSQPIA